MKDVRLITVILVVPLSVFCLFSHADAYIGPGVGITMLWAFWAVLIIVLVAAGGVLVWPLRSLRRWWQSRSPKKKGNNADHH